MKELLYLGLDPSRYKTDKHLVHRPILQIKKKIDRKVQEAFLSLPQASIILLTSRVSVEIFFECCKMFQVEPSKKVLYLAIGRATALLLPSAISGQESSEGMCKLLEGIDRDRKIFYPHSERAREVLSKAMQNRRVIETVFYTTVARSCSFDDINRFSEIVFTSPSCVSFFFEKKILIRPDVKLTTIGSVTENALIQFLKQEQVNYTNSKK